MSKIQEIAAQYNYFTFDNMPENVLSDPWFKEKQDFKKEQFNKVVIPEGLQNLEGVEVCIFGSVKEQFLNNFKQPEVKEHELFYIDNFYICVYVEKYDSFMQLMQNRGKYHFFPVYEVINKLQRNTSYEQRKPFLSKVIQPNEIGVFTAKKVNDYATYCNEYIKAVNECNAAVNNKKAENEAKIKATIEALDGCKVSKYHNTTNIETKLFRINFELLDNGSYLSQKIEYKGGLKEIIDLNL